VAKDEKKSTIASWHRHRSPTENGPLIYKIEFPGMRGTAKPKPKTKRRDWQIEQVEEAFRIVFPPEGRAPPDLTHKQVQKYIKPVFEKRRWKLASTESIRRVRERQKRSG
jgi:hypothetical protein